MNGQQKTCFVISPIGELGSTTRDRADLVYEFVIEAALQEEFEILRADKLSEPGLITNQIIERIINADLVIADLSERNPNVFYELAIRHVAKKPYVHLIAHDEDIPFDNAGVRAIKVDVKDLRSVSAAVSELKAQVNMTMMDHAQIESPISISVSLQDMKSSGDQEKVAMSALSQQLSVIASSINEMRYSLKSNNQNNSTFFNAIIKNENTDESAYTKNVLSAAAAAAAASSASRAAISPQSVADIVASTVSNMENLGHSAHGSGILGSRHRGKKL